MSDSNGPRRVDRSGSDEERAERSETKKINDPLTKTQDVASASRGQKGDSS